MCGCVGEKGGYQLSREERWEESGKFKGMNSTLGLISSFGNNGVIIMQEHRLDHIKLISSVRDFPWQIALMLPFHSSLINI